MCIELLMALIEEVRVADDVLSLQSIERQSLLYVPSTARIPWLALI